MLLRPNSWRIAVFPLALVALGCGRTIHVQIPNDFHGQVRVVCGEIAKNQNPTLIVGNTGVLTDASCPTGQVPLQVRRLNGTVVSTSAKWGITGDGIVREIGFEVP